VYCDNKENELSICHRLIKRLQNPTNDMDIDSLVQLDIDEDKIKKTYSRCRPTPNNIKKIFNDLPDKITFGGFKKYITKKMQTESWIHEDYINCPVQICAIFDINGRIALSDIDKLVCLFLTR